MTKVDKNIDKTIEGNLAKKDLMKSMPVMKAYNTFCTLLYSKGPLAQETLDHFESMKKLDPLSDGIKRDFSLPQPPSSSNPKMSHFLYNYFISPYQFTFHVLSPQIRRVLQLIKSENPDKAEFDELKAVWAELSKYYDSEMLPLNPKFTLFSLDSYLEFLNLIINQSFAFDLLTSEGKKKKEAVLEQYKNGVAALEIEGVDFENIDKAVTYATDFLKEEKLDFEFK